MARNGSGTYSKVNTFVAGNTITAAGHNANWDDAVLEITNSVAADGQTTITGALKGAAGTVSAPGYSFSADLDCGMYRIGANNIGLAVNGAKVIDIATTGASVTGNFSASGSVSATGVTALANGTVAAPGLTFASDLDSGLYRIGANNLGLALNGAKVVEYTTAGVSVVGTFQTTSTIQVTAGGLTVVDGGLTVTAGGLTVTAGSVSLPSGSVANASLADPPGVVKPVARQTASASADITFDAEIDNTYRTYWFVLDNIVPANDGVTFFMEVSPDGATWRTANYLCVVNAASGTTTAQSSGTASILLSQATDVDAGATAVGWSGNVFLFNPASSSMKTAVKWDGMYLNSGATSVINADGAGYYNSAAEVVTAVRFKFSGGNIATGGITMYGMT